MLEPTADLSAVSCNILEAKLINPEAVKFTTYIYIGETEWNIVMKT